MIDFLKQIGVEMVILAIVGSCLLVGWFWRQIYVKIKSVKDFLESKINTDKESAECGIKDAEKDATKDLKEARSLFEKEFKEMKISFDKSITQVKEEFEKARASEHEFFEAQLGELKEVSRRDDDTISQNLKEVDESWRKNTQASHAKMEHIFEKCQDDIKKIINDVGELKGRKS